MENLPEAITFLIVASFVLETAASGLMSVVSLAPRVREVVRSRTPKDAKDAGDATMWRRAIYFVLASTVALVYCLTADFGILATLEFETGIDEGTADQIFTAFLLVAGSARIAALKKLLGDAQEEEPSKAEADGTKSKPFHVEGEIATTNQAAKPQKEGA